MKKIIITTMFLSISFLTAQLRVGADLGGQIGATVEGEDASSNMKMGISLAYDHMFSDMVGAGFEYQLGRKSDEDDDGTELSLITVYGVGNYNINDKMAAKLRVGYAVKASMGDAVEEMGADLKGGLMFGLGVGYGISDNLGLDVGYYSNAFKADFSFMGESFSFDYKYTRIQAGLTYSF